MEVEESILSLAPNLTQTVERMFADYSNVDKELVTNLLVDETIMKIPTTTPAPESLCAVDGARVESKMYAADLLIAVATSADGSTGKTKHEPLTKAWGDVLPNDTANPRLSATAMACLEANLLAELSHYHIRILDGSFLTPIFGLQKGVETSPVKILNKVYTILGNEEIKARESLHAIYTPNPGHTIVAIPKSDTSTTYVEKLNKKYERTLSLKDRFFATVALRENELLLPQQKPEMSNLFLNSTGDVTKRQKKILDETNDGIKPLVEALKNGQLWFTYMKPKNSNTVIKFEFFAPNNITEARKEAELLAGYINNETYAPHMLEPYPQVVVDKKAKLISPSMQALRSLIANSLSEDEKDRYGAFLLQDYRT